MRRNIEFCIGAILFTTLMSGCETQGKPPVERDTADSRRYVTANSLNLRDCAGTKCRVIGSLKRGDSGVVISVQAGWAKLDIDGSSATGWVAGRYLSTQPVKKRQTTKSTEKKIPAQPKMPEEGFATADQTPPPLTEELATKEQANPPSPVIMIEEEFAK